MIERIKDIIIGSLYPPVCPVCERVIAKNKIICEKCKNEIALVKEPTCIKCGKPLSVSDKLYCKDCNKRMHIYDKSLAVFEYSKSFKATMYRFKYSNAREYGNFFAKVADALYDSQLKQWGIQVIIPVPLYKKKEVSRGYNQAKVFGKSLSYVTGIPLEDKLIIRRKSTVPQKELSDEMRRINLEKAFAVKKEKAMEYTSVLLVDDIYTTGSTLDACAKVLKVSGVKKVYCMCISIGRD